mmetsp:Transcript_45263/g.108177  ORF Transcript_45263/g.108177 Transcript_45263/m.108177 type:complete len:296 (+) Transcript_45263:3673-4560(+)
MALKREWIAALPRDAPHALSGSPVSPTPTAPVPFALMGVVRRHPLVQTALKTAMNPMSTVEEVVSHVVLVMRAHIPPTVLTAYALEDSVHCRHASMAARMATKRALMAVAPVAVRVVARVFRAFTTVTVAVMCATMVSALSQPAMTKSATATSQAWTVVAWSALRVLQEVVVHLPATAVLVSVRLASVRAHNAMMVSGTGMKVISTAAEAARFCVPRVVTVPRTPIVHLVSAVAGFVSSLRRAQMRSVMVTRLVLTAEAAVLRVPRALSAHTMRCARVESAVTACALLLVVRTVS